MEVYNNLLEIDDCLPHVPDIEEQVIPGMIDLLKTYGLCEKVGISLVHKHWDLANDDEKVVDLENDSHSVSSVFSNGKADRQVLQPWNLLIPENPEITPAKFIVRDNAMIPYEYDCVDFTEATYREERIQAVPAEFLHDFTAMKASCDVPEMLGLAVLPSGGVSEGWEVSDREARLNIVTFGVNNSPDFESVTTVWWAGRDGRIRCRGCTVRRRHHVRKL
jgi:hypothetical protein